MEKTLVQSTREAELVRLLRDGVVSVRTEGALRIVEVAFALDQSGEASALFNMLATMAEED